jgi:hypothetical protein
MTGRRRLRVFAQIVIGASMAARFNRFGGGSKYKAVRLYMCKCGMEWAAVKPESNTKADKLKVKTCPSCGYTEPIFFASKREALRYRELCLARDAGLISDIELQPRFDMPPGIAYVADFAYTDKQTGRRVVLDAKGVKTDVFKLKMKLLSFYFPDVEISLV